ncbi:MAG TPA: phosphotransferase [Acidimicrobiales bacterium]|nr:phosphotransferase [Acidimicrobiales bacterium]
MQPIGPKLAEGRDSVIYEHGPGRVLRVPADGRSLEHEAEIMRYVHSKGYPIPAVHDAGDGYLVMDRVDGPTMIDAALKQPHKLRSWGRRLAALHEQLHAIEAPEWMRMAPLPGDRIVHRDLHPLNVLMSADGPIVIDWSNASRGDPAFDVADTWVLLSTASPDLHGIEKLLAPLARRLFLRGFLGALDRGAARRAIPAAVEHRLTDRNHRPEEHERMRALAAWASNV